MAQPQPGSCSARLDVALLTAGVCAGEAAAFDRFYDAYCDRMYTYLLSRARGHEDLARDALQEAMLRVVRHLQPVANEGELWTWLVQVLRSAMIDQMRRNLAQQPKSRCAVDGLDDRRDVSKAESEEARHAELLALLGQALQELPPAERALVEDCYMQGLNHRELSARAEISPRAVEGRLARIRKRLRAAIQEGLRHV